MQLVLFHLMPYADLDLEAGRKNGTVVGHAAQHELRPGEGAQAL